MVWTFGNNSCRAICSNLHIHYLSSCTRRQFQFIWSTLSWFRWLLLYMSNLQNEWLPTNLLLQFFRIGRWSMKIMFLTFIWNTVRVSLRNSSVIYQEVTNVISVGIEPYIRMIQKSIKENRKTRLKNWANYGFKKICANREYLINSPFKIFC